MPAEPCPCRSPLPTIRVEGRTEDILHVPRPDGEMVALLPMALATVVEETPGVHRFQIVQTCPTTLAVRLKTDPDTGREEVWAAVRARLAEYLSRQGLPAVALELAAEAPTPSPRGGKLRHVLAMPALPHVTPPLGPVDDQGRRIGPMCSAEQRCSTRCSARRPTGRWPAPRAAPWWCCRSGPDRWVYRR